MIKTAFQKQFGSSFTLKSEELSEMKLELLISLLDTLQGLKENSQYKLVPDGLYEMLTSGQDSISEIKYINTRDLLAF